MSSSARSASSRASTPKSASSATINTSLSDSEDAHVSKVGGKRKRSVDDPSEILETTAEAAVLSHAALRKRKKQALCANPERDAAKSRATADDGSSAKRQNSVWVGNLSFRTTPSALRVFFDGVGTITRLHMPTKGELPGHKPEGQPPKAKAENRGFAYIDFATPDAKIIAISMSEQNLEGRRLLIKDGDDFTGRPAAETVAGQTGAGTAPVNDASTAAFKRPSLSKTAQKILRQQKQPPGPTLFLGNLGFEASAEAIQRMIDAHSGAAPSNYAAIPASRETKPIDEFKPAAKGDSKEEQVALRSHKQSAIRKVRMGTFEDSGHCKGFAFVDFHTTEQATAVLINPRNHYLDGRNLVVEYAGADAIRRGAPKGLKPPTSSELGPIKLRKDGLTERRPPGLHARRDAYLQPEPVHDARPHKRIRAERPPTDAPAAEESYVPPTRSNPRPGKCERVRGRGDATTVKTGPRRRLLPGAALAEAPRASAAIVPSLGKKIVF